MLVKGLNYKLIIESLIFLLIFTSKVSADTFIPNIYQSSDYFSSNAIRVGVQGPDKFIWLGTNEGLNRFDGNSSKVFRHNMDDENSISSNRISGLVFDKEGSLWIATENGLNKFDPKTEIFSHFFADGGDPDSLPDNFTKSIAIDSKGDIWVTTIKGLARLAKGENKFTVFQHNPTDNNSITDNELRTITIDKNDDIWLSYEYHGVTFFQPKLNKFVHFTKDNSQLKSNEVSTIFIDHQQNLWFGYHNLGLTQLNLTNNVYTHFFHEPSNPDAIGGNSIRKIIQDNKNRIWIAHKYNGISILDLNTKVFSHVKRSNIDPVGLNDNSINDLLMDSDKNIWVMTQSGGVNVFPDLLKLSDNFRLHDSDWTGISDNSVMGIFEDSLQRLWIGTQNFGVHIIDRNQKTNRHIKLSPDNNQGGRVLDIIERNNGDIWLATSAGVGVYNEQQEKLILYSHKSGHPPKSITILKLFEDKSNTLWIGTYNGLYKFDDKNGNFISYKTSVEKNTISNNSVTSFVEDKAGKLWIGTRKGLSLYQPQSDDFKRVSLSSNDVWSLAYDSVNNQLLIGTLSDGLIYLDLNTKLSRKISLDEGLAGESVFCILQNGNDFWASTNIGLSKISAEHLIENFYWYHGLQDGYNYNSCTSSQNGELFFGGGTGVSYFSVKALTTDQSAPVVHLTKLSIYDAKSNQFNAFKMNQEKPEFSFHQNNINFEFTGIYYTAPAELHYEYKLAGYNNQWIKVDGGNLEYLSPNKDSLIAKYTNLSDGIYDFQIRAISPDNIVSNVASYQFSISPPWWKTPISFFAYFIVVVALLYFVYKFRVKLILEQNLKLEAEVRNRTFQLVKKTQLANKLSEEKKSLFENVSHEFRTPLTLIISSIHELSVEEGIKKNKSLDLIKSNTYRLLKMVEQLLDFASIENGHEIRKKQYEVVACIDEVLSAFESLFIDKELEVIFNSDQQCFIVLSEDALEKILINLISNAVKYTPLGGSIYLSVSLEENQIKISISDTGEGIALEDRAIVFERFQRGNKKAIHGNPGSGIGLALVKELVELNNGFISIDEDYIGGCKIDVLFSFDNTHQNQLGRESTEVVRYAALEKESRNLQINDKENVELFCASDSKPIALIIEDNIDLQMIISNTVSGKFTCINAYNGQEGIEAAISAVPDIVICDVMMPIKDGFDVLSALKNDEKTSHIPFMMLTAKGDFKSRMQGWESLADEYLIKPFDKRELLARATNLLSIRESLRKSFGSKIAHSKPTLDDLAQLSQKDSLFVTKFEDLIGKHYFEPNLNRAKVAQKLAMSDRQLNRKLPALFGCNFSEYLRKFRLRKSLELIAKGILIAEISDQVGFSSPTYFSSCFKAEYGETPKQLWQRTLSSQRECRLEGIEK